MKKVPESIQAAFNAEGLQVIDKGQIEELERWRLLDFQRREADSYKSCSSLVVVCGCGRSGTTLARVILDTHSQIYSGPESSLFLPKQVDEQDLSFKFGITASQIQSIKRKSFSHAQFIDLFQALVLRQNGKTVWADKTARNAHCLPYIKTHFPGSKIIHVVRDPRDVVASLRTHKKRKLEDGEIRSTGYIMPLSLCVDRWAKAIEDVLPFRRRSDYHEVRYEDIVFNTEDTTKKVCAFLGLPFEEKMLDFHTIRGGTRDYHKFPQNIEATNPISAASVGRYKTVLTQTQIKCVEESLGPLAQAFGYTFRPELPENLNLE